MPIEKNPQDQYQKILLDLLKLEENKECADCHAKGPRWASASIGVFVCIKCSGIHRSMGTHISFVRSVTLDRWNAEQVKMMQDVGNGKAREYYEAALPDNYRRPNESDSYALEQFIRGKYERREFVVKDTKLKSGKKNSNKSSKSETPPPTEKKTPVNIPSEDLLSFGDGNAPSVSQPPKNDFSGFQSASTNQQNFSAFQGSNTAPSSFSAFQSANVQSNQTNFSAFQGANANHQGSFDGGFINPTPSTQSAQKFDSESAFFGGDTQQSAKPTKFSIMQLYNTPTSAPSNPLPNTFGQQQSVTSNSSPAKTNGANYNVALPGLGLPMTPPPNIVGGGNYYNNPGANFVGYARPPVNYVNTNGYVNANFKQGQQPKFM